MTSLNTEHAMIIYDVYKTMSMIISLVTFSKEVAF